MATVTELLDPYVELFNTGRFDEGLRDFAPGGYSEEIGTNHRFTPEEGVTNARAWKAAFPDGHGTITTKIVQGSNGAAEIVWRGTNGGPLLGEPPTGKSVTMRAVLIIETQDGKITRSAHYLDLAGLRAQLGVAPARVPVTA